MDRFADLHRNHRLAGLLAIIMLSGCGDDPAPLQSQTSATLLAGEVGKSKSWRLLSISEQVEEGEQIPLALDACVLDNIYTFTNNSDQSYQATEGATKCAADHPDLVESGTWAFTSDGRQVMILSTTILPSNPGTLFSYYGLAFPGEVLELRENALKIKMTFTRQQSVSTLTIYYFMTFTRP